MSHCRWVVIAEDSFKELSQASCKQTKASEELSQTSESVEAEGTLPGSSVQPDPEPPVTPQVSVHPEVEPEPPEPEPHPPEPGTQGTEPSGQRDGLEQVDCQASTVF